MILSLDQREMASIAKLRRVKIYVTLVFLGIFIVCGVVYAISASLRLNMQINQAVVKKLLYFPSHPCSRIHVQKDFHIKAVYGNWILNEQIQYAPTTTDFNTLTISKSMVSDIKLTWNYKEGSVRTRPREWNAETPGKYRNLDQLAGNTRMLFLASLPSDYLIFAQCYLNWKHPAFPYEVMVLRRYPASHPNETAEFRSILNVAGVEFTHSVIITWEKTGNAMTRRVVYRS